MSFANVGIVLSKEGGIDVSGKSRLKMPQSGYCGLRSVAGPLFSGLGRWRVPTRVIGGEVRLSHSRPSRGFPDRAVGVRYEQPGLCDGGRGTGGPVLGADSGWREAVKMQSGLVFMGWASMCLDRATEYLLFGPVMLTDRLFGARLVSDPLVAFVVHFLVYLFCLPLTGVPVFFLWVLARLLGLSARLMQK